MSFMKRSLPFVAAALTATACADSPAEPVSVPPSASAAPLRSAAASAASLDFDTDLNDIRNRVLPSFADEAAAERIAAAIGDLSAQLAAGDRVSAAASVALIRGELKPEVASDADLSTVELALDAIQRAL
jgi:hypothetical protein